MGKKNKDKNDKFKANPFDYMGGGRIRELGDRYGVDHTDYNINYDRNDGGTGRTYKGGREEYEAAIAKAAMSDYDTRRTMEAQAMAGNKDAKKFAKKGFKNIGKVIEGNELMRDLHKEYGNGGSFSSASDFAGLTYKSVKEDRNNFIADNDAKYASQADLESMREKMKEQGMPGRQETEGMSFNDYMKGTFGSKYEEIARGPAPYTDGDQDGGTSLPSPSESSSGETAAAAAAQSNLADTVAGLSAVGGAAANKHKMGMYALGSLTGGV